MATITSCTTYPEKISSVVLLIFRLRCPATEGERYSFQIEAEQIAIIEAEKKSYESILSLSCMPVNNKPVTMWAFSNIRMEDENSSSCPTISDSTYHIIRK